MKYRNFLLFIVCLCSLSARAFASVRGVVRDPQNQVVEGARVEIRGTASPVSQTATTNAAGEFQFVTVSAGQYTITVTFGGFSPLERTVQVMEGTDTVLQLQLSIERLEQLVDVSTTIPRIETDVAGKSTASRLDIPTRDLPVQVSSIPAQALAEQGVNDMVTALRNASGVSAFRAYGMYEYETVRGFNGGGITSIDARLVDGMRLEGNRLNTQLNEVEQIDVLKGPNSILYGGNVLGGAINIIRKKPQAAPLYDFFYRAGRFNTHQVGAGATGRVLGVDRLWYRVDVSGEHADGWRNAGARRLNISPALTWVINDTGRVTIRETVARDNYDGDAGLPLGVANLRGFDLSRRLNTSQDFAHFRDSQTQVLLNIGLSNNFELRNSFLYRWTNDQYFTAEQLTYRSELNQVDRQFLYFQHHRRPVLNQTDLVGRFNLWHIRHTFLAGYEYEDFYNYTDRSASRSVAATPISLSTFQETQSPIPDFPLSRVDYFANRNHGLYWQDQIALTERLKLNVGGRFDDFDRGAHNDPWANGQRVSRGPEQHRHQTPYTYRAGVVYGFTANQQVYFNSSSSFQPVTQIPADGRELLPETGHSFEFGHRLQAMNGRMEVTTALYRIVRENVVIALPNQLFDQAGQQSSKGVDFDVNGEIGKGIHVIANYGYTLPRFDDYFESNGLLNLKGFQPKFTHKHAANVWLTKSWKGGFTTSIGSRYLSSVFNDNADTVRLGGWTVFNGAVGFRRSNYEWSLNAENLFNRNRYFLPAQYTNQVYPGQPINVFTTVRFHFR
jgi:iron complex outermembrane recepter protein